MIEDGGMINIQCDPYVCFGLGSVDPFKWARKRELGNSMLLPKQGNKLEKQMVLKIVYYQGLNMALILFPSL